MSNQDNMNGPVQSLDTQIASTFNDVERSIQSHYSTTPNNLGINATKTTALSYRMPQSQVKMPSAVCTIDFLSSANDLNLDKNIKSLSFDPIIKRLVQEKNNIMRDIEGWIACQANDGARQPILATTIIEWTQKAIGYIRCGTQLIKSVTTLINSLVTDITNLINSVTLMINSDLMAIKTLQNQMATMQSQLKKEGLTLITIASINFLQDELALYNEIGAATAELKTLKASISIQHLKGQIESAIDQFLSVIGSFNQKMGSIQRHQTLVISLNSAIVNLNQSLSSVNSIDLSISSNPGGINPGALNDFTVTNNTGLFTDFDGLTTSTYLAEWDNDIHPNFDPTTTLWKGGWSNIFTSNEVGNLVFANNNFGAFELCASLNMQSICPASSISARMIINGGQWVLQTSIHGYSYEDDDPTETNYSTKFGIFTSVPSAPAPGVSIGGIYYPSKDYTCTFTDFINAANVANFVSGPGFPTITPQYIDPTNPDQGPVNFNTSVNLIIVPGSPSIAYTIDTVTGAVQFSLIDWMAIAPSMRRFASQNEIALAENQYSTILQALGISPQLFVNPYSQVGNPLYNTKNDPNSSIYNPATDTYTLKIPGTHLDPITLIMVPNEPYDPSDPYSLISDLPVSLPSKTVVFDNVLQPLDYNIVHYKMPTDTQLTDALINKKPFPGMTIYCNSIDFQITARALNPTSTPRFHTSGDETYDQFIVPFGLQADWGFAPTAQLS
jgi:hypothetical protein